MKTALVTDSTADIPQSCLQQYPIHVIPNLIMLEGETYEDGKGISREEFYQRMSLMRSLPTTATASAGVYQELYASLLSQGFQEILSIHASSLLSGIFNAAQTAAQAFQGCIRIIDSEQISMGLGFQVLEAARAIAQGTPVQQIVDQLAAMRRRIRVFALLDTLEFVRRSGRVSWARARLGTLFQIKPIVELKSGRVLSQGEARTRRKGIERLLEILHSLGALEQLAILHSNAEEDAQKLLAELNPDLLYPPMIVNVTTIIGAHVGPNGLGFAAVAG